MMTKLNIIRSVLSLIIIFTSIICFNCAAFDESADGDALKPISNAGEMQKIFEKNKGKVVLINFWATWCGPCVKEFPELIKLHSKYKDKGFRLIFISLDDLSEVDSKLKPFLKKNGVDFTTYYNSFQKPEEMIDIIDKNWQGAIPTTYIYDKEGKLKSSLIGSRSYEEFEKEIKPLLGSE